MLSLYIVSGSSDFGLPLVGIVGIRFPLPGNRRDVVKGDSSTAIGTQ